MKIGHIRLCAFNPCSCARAIIAIFAINALVAQVHAQLRVVTYNTTGAPRSGMDIVLKSIGEETRNGFAKPIDILLLQEQNNINPFPGANNPSPDTQAFVALLNNIYAGQGITYNMSNRTGTGDSTQTLIYRTETVQLLGDVAVNNPGAPRQPLRFQLRPVGYSNPSSDFYIYNSHYKASLDNTPPGSNANQRNNEATAIRSNSNALGEGTHAIYAGDHNFYYSNSQEPAWGTLTAAGAGQANDPLNRVGSWHSNSSFADVHTQSPCNTGCTLVGGGMDDRFDFQLVTGELLDGEGMSYVGPTSTGMSGTVHSYHAFGNNGSTYNTNINSSSNTVTFPGVTSYTKSQILNALWSVSDHLPVVADYQVPAVMNVLADAVPTTLDLGQAFSLNVAVNNSANVVAAIGADELDYSLTTSGGVSGTFLSQVDLALGGSNSYSVIFDTATIGLKTGAITITSTSQGVEGGLVTIPISFTVVLPGDYDGNGIVDAADYSIWRVSLGQNVAIGSGADGDRNGIVDEGDYSVWQSHFGISAVAPAASLADMTVPEPASLVLLLIGACLVGRRPTTLRT
jgi:hypothetical protein